MKGKYIVVEGIEGAGKTNATSLIEQVLKDHFISKIDTREPGGTPVAEALRGIVKADGFSYEKEELYDKSELLILYAARHQLVEGVIKPALESGKWVIGDRHDLSTRAYQGGGRGIPDETIEVISNLTLDGFKPDLTIYMDVEPKIGLERARGRGELDRIEQMDLEFFERVRAKYLELATSDPNTIIIDASKDIKSVQNDIMIKLSLWLQDNIV
ncbi:dTMP kinase [Vibrio sp. D431a]|uniref:dTMP kinase n=1 Tax=Vibrio sp. D431a TaxID=2837388 RepID=UPI0025547013|nr:dTMP kinase [Vibrio sp. D431a]MDK9789959.1 dTMP kinase [Vibrio sp. D431a]